MKTRWMRGRKKCQERVLAEHFGGKERQEEPGAKNIHHPKCKGLTTPTMGNGAGEKGACAMGTPIWENNLALKGDTEAMWTGNYTSRCTM